MKFEEKKFCKISTLCERWDVSVDRIVPLMRRQLLRPWHPERIVGQKGILVDVSSVLEVEKNGYINIADLDE